MRKSSYELGTNHVQIVENLNKALGYTKVRMRYRRGLEKCETNTGEGRSLSSCPRRAMALLLCTVLSLIHQGNHATF